ncbi:MAG: hypothetical protein LBV12_01525, partial [Puniceicoccales bacterium]|nr:hypothetical protein [Puniceicoccales bacterium]
ETVLRGTFDICREYEIVLIGILNFLQNHCAGRISSSDNRRESKLELIGTLDFLQRSKIVLISPIDILQDH